MNQKISTGLGTAIILVMAFTAGYFVWVIEKDYQAEPVVGANQNRSIISESTAYTVKEINRSLSENNKTFCDGFSGESNSEIREISGRRGWNSFTNFRDSYKFEYPTDELEVSGLATRSSDKIIWSAQIGYPGRLGAFADFKIYCGNTEEAISSYYDNNERIKIVSREKFVKNSKNAVRILWKDVEYSDKAIGQQIYFQYMEDRVLEISGPFGDQKLEKIFDELIKSLVFLDKPNTR